MAATYAYPTPVNSSLTFSHVVQNFGIDGVAQEYIPNMAIYLNGTAQDVSAPLRYNLGSNDSLEINLILPCTGYPSATVNVCEWGGTNGEGMWGQSAQLP